VLRLRSDGERVLGLDALRGLAIALVILAHAFPRQLEGAGIVGVIVFFTLSGYLITALLVGRAEQGRRDLRRFYRNRALRLLPALAAMLVVYGLVEAATNQLHDRARLTTVLVLGLGYLTDVPHFNRSVGIGLQHLWTLAVEEQFYLVWPVLILAAVRRNRLGLLLLTAGAALVTAATVSSARAARPDHVYVLPTSWASALVVGAAAYVYREPLRRAGGRLAPVVALLVLVGISLDTGVANAEWFYALGGPLCAVCSALLIGAAATTSSTPGWLVPGAALGRISYAVYLWNLPIVKWLTPGHDPSAAVGFASILLTLAAATASWFAIEAPVARYRARLDARRAGIPFVAATPSLETAGP
jgi:peptidoglycan/LPS O-acetylase OafA/YrhL